MHGFGEGDGELHGMGSSGRRGDYSITGKLRLLQAVTKRVYMVFEKRGGVGEWRVTGVRGFKEPKAGRTKNPHYYYSINVVVVTPKNGCANFSL